MVRQKTLQFKCEFGKPIDLRFMSGMCSECIGRELMTSRQLKCRPRIRRIDPKAISIPTFNAKTIELSADHGNGKRMISIISRNRVDRCAKGRQ